MASDALSWRSDDVLPGFEAATLTFPDDYDGPVTATLVRRLAGLDARGVVLYIHGYVDYFFQAHLAEEYRARGWHFYALDLRKCGRSLGDAAHPNFCKSLGEYDGEITAAIDHVDAAHPGAFSLLNGHSTGGLTAALYAGGGPRSGRIDALFLNSPFFALNAHPWLRALVAQASLHSLLDAPFLTLPVGLSPVYAESVHRDYRGEWEFDLRWKPLAGFPLYRGWLLAVAAGQERLRRGLGIACPTLVMHSDRSASGGVWDDAFLTADGVLNVADIRRRTQHLGRHVTRVEIAEGMHDLVLSRPDVRARVFAELFRWLDYARAAGYSA